jgi:hypothetical protein
VTGLYYEGLNVTYDGARSWRQVSLQAPPGIQGSHPSYDLPVFTNSKHGFEAVTYCDPWNATAVLFETHDGGNTWRPDRILSGVKQSEEDYPCRVASTVVGNVWVIAASTHSGKPTLRELGPGQRATASDTLPPTDFQSSFPTYSPLRLSFVSPTDGWMWRQGLHSTNDGGKTWTLIDPDPAYGVGDSLHGIAQVLNSAAAKVNPDLRAFSYRVLFHPQALLPQAERLPIGLIVNGSFETPDDDIHYWDATWRQYEMGIRRLDDRLGQGVFRQRACDTAPEIPRHPMPTAQPQPSQPIADHPPLNSWSIDFPRLLNAVRQNAALFPKGALTIEVATAHRLGVEDQPKGCEVVVYNGDANYRRLSGVDGAQTVAEIESYPVLRPPNCREANYLILDADTGATIEHGTYKRCLLLHH